MTEAHKISPQQDTFESSSVTEAYKKSSLRDTFESLVVTVILAIFGTTFVIQAFKIPTGSMEKTLLIGDHLLVNKFAFSHPSKALSQVLPYRDVHHGDVIVFKFPGPVEEQSEPGEHYVKRVIGLSGDRVRIFHRQVYLNGQPLSEPYVIHAPPDFERPGDDFPPPDSEYLQGSTALWTAEMPNHVDKGELVVPAGSYFVMGDNREQSWDSRFWGFVPRELISGRPLLIYWSYETPNNEYLHASWSDWLSQTFSLIIHFPTRTRWRRTLKMVR